MGNSESLGQHELQQVYKIDGNVVNWKVFKKVCISRCNDANRKVRALGTWSFGGTPKTQIDANNSRLNEYLLISKPQKRETCVTFNVPNFTSMGIMGIA